jgi:hypothetical protein
MNKELRSELETRGNLLETMRAKMETFKRAKSATGGGGQSFKMVCFHLRNARTPQGRQEVLSVEGPLRMKQEKKG